MEVTTKTVCLPQELRASTLYVLSKLGYGAQLQMMDEFEKAAAGPVDYSVLALLDEAVPEAQSTIADLLKIDRSQLVGLLDSLEERGLIERRRDPKDRRRHLVTVTPSGKQQLARLRKIVAQIEDEFLAPLDADERAQLHELLLRVAQNRDARFATATADA